MPYRSSARPPRPAMFNTPAIRNGGFGALQVEAVTNRPLSIARRHLAASQLRMRDIEPDELSSSEWVRFLVMEEQERDRWMAHFLNRRRRGSDESTSSNESESQTLSKAEEAQLESEEQGRPTMAAASSSSSMTPVPAHSRTPSVSLWARQYVDSELDRSSVQAVARPAAAVRAITAGPLEAPPTYETAVRARTPPPAYQTRLDYDRAQSPTSP